MAEKSVSTDSLAMHAHASYAGKRLRVAYIGCGGVLQFHMSALVHVPEIEVVAGCDIDPARLSNLEHTWGVKRHYSDWKQMLREVKPDAVSVCTPNGLHMQPVIDAADAGCHVIVEKPMAMNPDQCRQMIDAAKRNNVKLAVGFQYRFHPYTDFLLKQRDAGTFGNILFVRCQALRRRGIPNWGVFGRKELQGGGPMIDIGVHVIEMAHHLIGSPEPVAASGNTWTYLGNKASEVASMWPGWDYKTYNVEDLAIGQVRFANGAILQIEAMFAGHIEKDVWNFTFMGDKGGGHWDPPMVFTDRAGSMVNESPGWISPKTDFQTLFQYKLKNFADACLNDRPLRAPGEAGLAVQKILDGVYRSAAAGREVEIA
jgi:predicted dehydrogenase